MDINEVLYLDEYYDLQIKCALYQTDTILEMGILQESILCESKIDIKKIIENFINFIKRLISKIKSFFRRFDKSLYDMSKSDDEFYKKTRDDLWNIRYAYGDDFSIKLDDEIIIYKPEPKFGSASILSLGLEWFLADDKLSAVINHYLYKTVNIHAMVASVKCDNINLDNIRHDYSDKDNVIKKLKEVLNVSGNDYNEIMRNYIHESKCKLGICKEINDDVIGIIINYYMIESSPNKIGFQDEKKAYLEFLDKINKNIEKAKILHLNDFKEAKDVEYACELLSILPKVISVETTLFNIYYQEYFNIMMEYGRGIRKLAILAVTQSKKLKQI